QRNSIRFCSAIWKDLERLRSKLLIPPVRTVLRPTVAALCTPLPWVQWTLAGVTQRFVSGLRYPVVQSCEKTARLLRGAFGLLMSGGVAALPLKTVNGAPDWKEVMPAMDHALSAYFQKWVAGPGTDQT